MEYLELIEQKKHGTPEFPIEYYHLDKAHPRYVMRAHWHNESELVRVLRGGFTVYLNNVKYELSEGDCLFIGGGCLMQGSPTENSVYECLVFDTAMLKRQRMSDTERYFDIGGESVVFRASDEDTDAVTQVIFELFDSVRDAAPHYELKTLGLLYKLFFEMYTGGYIERRSEVCTDRGLMAVSTLLQWIENNLFEPISLFRLAEVSGLSEKYICRIFKRYTSKTVTEYVNEQRIEIACIEMARKSITEVAFATGFNDLSYFCKIFKRYKGMSPREYKDSYIK